MKNITYVFVIFVLTLFFPQRFIIASNSRKMFLMVDDVYYGLAGGQCDIRKKFYV